MQARVVLLPLLLAGAIGAAEARPWLEPDDLRARHSVQWLADRGCFNAPVSTWPLMWADLSPGLDAAATLPECRDSAAWRYLAFERDYQRNHTIQASVTLGGASDEPVFRGFSAAPREEAEASVRLEMSSGRLAMGLTGTWTNDPRDGDSGRVDGSYLAGTAGNWVLGAGAIDRWWGPGWRSSTILSDNARPAPGVWINRRASTPSGWRPASWLGPWNFTAFAGQLERERYVPRTKLIGMRFSFKPWRYMEVGLSRTVQWGGSGRPQGFSSFWEAMIGRDNGQRGPDGDPGNQLGGADVRFGFPVGSTVLGVYGQVTGEDEAGGLPSTYMGLAGIDLGTQLWQGEQRLFVEYTDTTAGAWSHERRPNVGYEHSIYRTGYRFNGRNIASTWESDAQVLSVGVSHFFSGGQEVSVGYDRAKLNRDGTQRPRPASAGIPMLDPIGRQDVDIYSLQYRQPLLRGRLTLSAYYTDKEIRSALDDYSRGTVMALWEFRFD
ncbi:capsule assembly Wzi family protein [Isoalcanivorax beigongshangi]|uniref:Capsule assembly Wzi family protein n=1 Tax=Isoalcanivorax beigongshangi TaxID=3238810 RepID=A0ABV4AIQ0_9GAMM